MSEKTFVREEIKEIIIYVFLLGLTLILPLLAGLIGRGFEESFVQGQALEFGTYLSAFLTYLPFLIVSLLVVIFPIAKLNAMSRNEHPAVKSNAKWTRIFTVSYLFAPESNGLLYNLSEYIGLKGKKNFMRWSLNPLRMIVASIIIFGIYGLILVSVPQASVSAVPKLVAQQVTITSEIIFNSVVPAFAENQTMLFIFMFLMGVGALVTSKLRGIDAKQKKLIFFSIGIVNSIIVGLIFGGLHSIVYGNLEVSFIATIVFGFFGTFITLLFGSFIPWWIWHISNNLFVTLLAVSGSTDDVFIKTAITLVVLLGIWIGVEILSKKVRNRTVSGL